ncbi:MAG: XRE family transcriptional regulator [Gemmatimonadota bacterium]|nr:XRE family transcriptional regulator [Gemmatimonadota bacterium]
MLKPIEWIGGSKKSLDGMPSEIKKFFGWALLDVQYGDTPDGAKLFGEGLPHEIWKIAEDHDGNTYRAAYMVKFPEIVYVLDVFMKKSKSGIKTPQADKNRVLERFKAAKRHYDENHLKRHNQVMERKTKRKTYVNGIEIEHGSGNVFEDLGFPDAAERLAKAELARLVRNIIREKSWTQAHAAGVLGIAASDMSDLVRGKLDRFSQERIARFLNSLDMDVRIQVAPRRAGKKRADITVEWVGA